MQRGSRAAGDPPLTSRLMMLTLVLALSILMTPAHLDSQRPDTGAGCKMGDGSMVKYGQCLDREYAAAGAELNRVYRRVLASLPAQERITLREAQRAWIKLRYADIAVLYTFAGGNHPSLLVLPEQIRMTKERTAFLRSLRS